MIQPSGNRGIIDWSETQNPLFGERLPLKTERTGEESLNREEGLFQPEKKGHRRTFSIRGPSSSNQNWKLTLQKVRSSPQVLAVLVTYEGE